MTDQYLNRELDEKFSNITEQLDRIEVQVRYTNGRVTKSERNLLIVACIMGTILFLKYPEVIKIIQIFI